MNSEVSLSPEYRPFSATASLACALVVCISRKPVVIVDRHSVPYPQAPRPLCWGSWSKPQHKQQQKLQWKLFISPREMPKEFSFSFAKSQSPWFFMYKLGIPFLLQKCCNASHDTVCVKCLPKCPECGSSWCHCWYVLERKKLPSSKRKLRTGFKGGRESSGMPM